MHVFLIAAAVLVGLANATLYSAFGDSAWGGPFVWRLEPWPLSAAYALCAVLTGLVVSGALLLFVSQDLQGSFFARYGLMVLAICLGGAMLATLLIAITFAFGDEVYVPSRTSELLYAIAFSAIPGGVLGAVEGVVLAFPLAATLGLFRGRD